MDRGAWWATVHGVANSWTRLSDFTLLHFGLLITSILTVVKVLLRDTGFLTAGSAQLLLSSFHLPLGNVSEAFVDNQLVG